MRVFIPSPLFSYTRGAKEVVASAASLAELLLELDRAYPGLRHRIVDEQDRIRPHMRFFVNGEMVQRIDMALRADDEVMIVASLSGG